MRFKLTKEIDAPVERVWSFIGDDEKLPLWITEIVEITYPQGRDIDHPVGTVFKQKLKEGGRVVEYDGVVRAYEPNQLLGLTYYGDQFSMDVSYRLAPCLDGGRTELQYVAKVEVKNWFAKIMGFLFQGLTRRLMTRHMNNLKALAEASG